MTVHQPIVQRRETIKLRIEDFAMLDDAGAFEGWKKTELIDGEVIGMNAQAKPHMRMKMWFYDVLRDAIRASYPGFSVFTEATVAFPDHNAPEPDVLVTNDATGTGFVKGTSVSLLVEVSDTTLSFDLNRKAVLYARRSVPEYWVADVNAGVFYQMWEPSTEGYRQQRQIAFGRAVQSITMPEIRFNLPDAA